MTPDERAGKILVEMNLGFSAEPSELKSFGRLIASAIRAAVEEATEDLTWNLASCSTFALGYGLDERFNKSKARAAMFDVHNLAMKYRTAKAEAYEDAAKIAENSFLDWELFLVDHAGDANLIAERAFIADRIRARAAEVSK